MRRDILICAVVAATVLSWPALAASQLDRADCAADEPSRKISGCTQIIQDVTETATNRALAFYMRGFAYTAKGNFDGAIADYNEAIRLNPKNAALAFNEPGSAYKSKGDTDRAIADFTEAIRLDPTYADIFFNRGITHMALGSFDRAIADFGEAIRLGSNQIVAVTKDSAIERLAVDRINSDYFGARATAYFYSANFGAAASDYAHAMQLQPDNATYLIWHYVARARSGNQSTSAELQSSAKQIKPRDWPFPVIELFMESLTPDATLAAATTPGDRCEAQFYVAEWYLLHEKRPEAKAALSAALATCSKDQLEFQGAQVELKRLAR
jgi:tetratricopeptide (TPR) repeat protein